ncbi:hypothetical protein [Flavobacterium piscis]|uniref:Uncharacterized protein n=1 Tax=Flavobacterium piscis TaxID=1114874 RepID=A0ABU1YD44_9FLAO|nr:hypothetical protein [Flavobacterium piscis]MDR7212083.1 hypothetical protein [Flavobacterium piscis]
MYTLQQTFEKSLEEYEGENAELLSIDDVVTKLLKELPNILPYGWRMSIWLL